MKNRKLLYTALSASLLLAACGTDTSEEDNSNQPTENSDQAAENGTNGSDVTENETDSKEDVEDKDVEKEENGSTEDGSEETSTDDSNSDANSSETDDVSKLDGAVETESDEQNFKIQVLPAYELTSEEPGRDLLYVKDQDDKYMVIGTMQASETDFDKAVENMTETLAATTTDATPAALTDETKLPMNKELEKLEAYRVTSSEGPITAMIFQKGEMIVRVMIYDTKDESYYEEFLQMAESIEAK